MSTTPEIGTPDEGFAAFMGRPLVSIETGISPLYENLGSVIGGGDDHFLRFLALARPGDKIRIPLSRMAITLEHLNHLKSVGIETVVPRDIIWSDTFGAGLIGEYSALPATYFMYDQRLFQYRPNQALLDSTLGLESKVSFALEWHNRGVMPPTVVVRSKSKLGQATAEEAWSAIGQCPGRLKAAFCASGNDNVCFGTLRALKRLRVSDKWTQADFVIQKNVGDKDVSMNYYIDDKGVYFLFGTLQMMKDGQCHRGNIQDSTYNEICRSLTDQIAMQAFERGFRGFVGFDLRVDSESFQAWVIECNARITAPVYGWFLAMKQGLSWFCIDTLVGVNPNLHIVDIIPEHLVSKPFVSAGAIALTPSLLRAGAFGVAITAPNQEVGISILKRLHEHASRVSQAVAA